MNIPHGDPLVMHMMMLHELDFGETEYILISGLKVGPYVDLLYDKKGQSNSQLRARLFLDISDSRLRLKDLEDLIMSPNYSALQDEDVGLHGRDVKTGIPAAVYKLADNIDDWNRFAWGTYFWKYTSRMMRGMFEKIEEFRQFKQANPESRKGHKYTIPGFMLPFKPNNQPINVVANPEELMLSFYVRYVNWTLNPVESPPRQHSPVPNSPPNVDSPARRRMYKSEIETSTTESATNASSSQHLETSYMSNDTSILKKKKKTSTKALVKHLIGVVADLTSKVDRALQKKDVADTNVEPDRGFQEEEEMINEEEEEKYQHHTYFDYDYIGTHGLEGEFGPTPTHVEQSSDVGEDHTKEMTPIGRPQRKRGVPWFQRTPFTVLQSTPKVKKIIIPKKKKVVKSPEKPNEDIVNEESNDVSNHLLLDSVEAASTLSFWKEWNSISSNLITKHRLHIITLDLEFWSRLLAVTDLGWLLSSVTFVKYNF
uniref:Phospholipase-like protein n=1 Tax=Lactuca sativa TaxID=4236 RepID=A0A9R1UPQ0_LACSA|nr:hypothetical protein LSAT_V11C800453850 [Lactuca sativa]